MSAVWLDRLGGQLVQLRVADYLSEAEHRAARGWLDLGIRDISKLFRLSGRSLVTLSTSRVNEPFGFVKYSDHGRRRTIYIESACGGVMASATWTREAVSS